jgi:site-specific recombinase XerD
MAISSPTQLVTIADVGHVATLPQAIAYFTTVGMPARNLSARTRIEYHNDLTDLTRWLEKHNITRVDQVGLAELEAYQAEMDRRGYAASSRERKTYAIKTFFKFLHHQGITSDDVATRLIPPQKGKREPRFLSEGEYQQLLRVASHHPRNAAIIELFLQTGMRLSELARLTLSDVEIPRRITRDPDNTGLVRVLRKRGKTQTIPLNYKACQAIASYLRVRPAVEHDTLFVTKFMTPISKRAVQHTITKYLHEVGITDASTHTLRHTMATHHVARGTDLKTIQETLGHERLETTAIYVSLAKTAQRKALQEHAL